jgi:hypothetical protein
MRLKTNKDHQTTGEDKTLRQSFGMSLAIGLGQAGEDWQWTIDDDFVVRKDILKNKKHECTCGTDKGNELECDCT